MKDVCGILSLLNVLLPLFLHLLVDFHLNLLKDCLSNGVKPVVIFFKDLMELLLSLLEVRYSLSELDVVLAQKIFHLDLRLFLSEDFVIPPNDLILSLEVLMECTVVGLEALNVVGDIPLELSHVLDLGQL